MSTRRFEGQRCHPSRVQSGRRPFSQCLCRRRWRNMSSSRGGARRTRISVGAQADDREARKKELEQRVLRLAASGEVLDDEEMAQLWDELQEVTRDPPPYDPQDKEEARANMQSFLETLFYNLSLHRNETFLSKEKVQRIFSGLPRDLAEKFKEAGIWDKLPTAGFSDEAVENLELWTEEEYEVFNDDPHLPPPLDEEEEIKRELTLIRAVWKLEQFLSTYPDDPGEVLNMMVAAKMAIEAKTDPFNPADFILDELEDDFGDDMDYLVDIDGIESCLDALERGEDAPAPDPNVDKVIKADSPEVFLERMQLMKAFYTDPQKKREDRSLSKQEYKEIKKRWDAFMPDEEPLVFKDIDHIRLAPDLPDWMEGHFRSLQHITYILRAAHINAKITEPGIRLKKYNRISDVTYTDPAVKIKGYDAFMKQMERLEAAGVTTEPSCLFGEVDPPKEKLDDLTIENPWNYTIIVDEHLNIPIPDWYHAILDAYEAKMKDDDLIQDDAEIEDAEKYAFMESMDKVLKAASPSEARTRTVKAQGKRVKEPHPLEVASDDVKQRFDDLGIGVKDGDPKLYEPVYAKSKGGSKKKEYKGSGKIKGDFWYNDSVGEAWKEGYMITVNATLIYKIDITAGQVCDIHMRWGAIVGSVLEAEDAEKIFCEVSGIDYEHRRYKHDFTSEWKNYEYKPIRNDPMEWFKRHVFGKE